MPPPNLQSAELGVSAITTVRPTRVRFRVAGLVFALAMVTYLDRACLATMAPAIMADFGLTKVQMGHVFSIFALAYAAFEIPTAWFADRYGAHRVLARIVIWWSTFTIATAATVGYWSLLTARFLFGAGEAGAWPCAARTIARWFPPAERGRVQGIFFAFAHLAGGLTPLLVTALLAWFSWRSILICFGAVGFVWVAAWLVWSRSEPTEHSAVNEAELKHIAAGREANPAKTASAPFRWRSLYASRNILYLCVMFFPVSFVFYFCITWLPTFLSERFGLTALSLGIFTGLPLILSVISDIAGGTSTDWLTVRFGPRVGRCGLGAVSYLVAGASLLVTPFAHQPWLAATLIAVGTAASMFSLGASWALCSEIGGDDSAKVGATMNTASQIGSMICPLLVGYTLAWFGTWNISLVTMGALFLVGAIAWLLIDPTHRLESAA